MNKSKKRGVIVFFIVLIILNNFLVLSAILNDYFKSSEALQTFIDSSGENKNRVWEESKKTENTYERGALAENAIKQIYKQKLKEDLAAGADRMLIQTWGNVLYQELEKKGVPAQLGIKIESFDKLKEIAAANKISLDITLVTQIESVEGFGSKDLSWSKNGKNIIGNGKTWINMDKLPHGINFIKYDESKKIFVLKTKDGGELVLGEGATDENGNVAMLSSLSKDSLLKKVIAPFSDPNKSLSAGLENFIINGKSGQVVLGKEGFEIIGDGTGIRYGDFIFGRKTGETGTGISTVKFSENEMVLKGIEFERRGYVKVDTTKFSSYGFTINFEANPDSVASRRSDFLCMYGENFAVGGKGSIEVLRNLNSLRGYSGKGFKVKVGDIEISFREKGIYTEFKSQVVKNSFTIDNVYAIDWEKSGNRYIPDKERAVEKPFKIVKSGETYIIETANLIAGKTTELGPLGSSVDVSLEVDKNDLDDLGFDSRSTLDKSFRNGFWHLCSLRFFYIYSYMKLFNIENVIHIENDVLLYKDINNYPFPTDRLSCVFDCYYRVVPSLTSIPNH